MAAPLIEFHDVSLGYSGHRVLADLTFTLHDGDFVALVGPNGVGKTTLLRAILGILPPQAGRLARRVVRVGYVPQERALDPVFPLSAFDVALQGRIGAVRPGHRPGPADLTIAREALARADVAALESRAFHDLSGGQKQRVLIARALAAEPVLMVLDEPTAGMDAAAERALMDLLGNLHAGGKLTICLASHNLGAVANYAGRIALIDRERGLFALGASGDLLTDETLSRLYGRSMRVRWVEGWRTIIAGGALC
ncbi:MAG: metal ABC transporter ATP-binding protein [Candidatus Rokuibacteriota bacterium]